MTRADAYKAGVASALEAAEYGAFLAHELKDRDAFVEAILDICQNKRQYAGHPGYDFNRAKNPGALWEAFDRGELAGARRARLGDARREAALMQAVHCGKG